MTRDERVTMGAVLTIAGALAAGCGGDGRNVEVDESATFSTSGADGSGETGPASTTDGAADADGTGADSTTGSTPDGDTTTGGPIDEGPGVDLQCAGHGGAEPGDGVICFYGVEVMDQGPAASLEYQLVDLNGQEAIYIRVVFAPWFVDNTYGENTIGWPDGHPFDKLVSSDHANLVMKNAAGDVVLDFDLDYLEDDDVAASGFRSQGVWEKNGGMNEPKDDPSAILAANTSLSRNLNERGYGEYTTDSPATDQAYTPNPAAPFWDFRVVYEVWVDASMFASDGDEAFAEACVQSIHASPSKSGDNTIEVVPDECPPGWGCFEKEGCTDCEPSSDPDSSDDCDPTDGIPSVP